jgi:hypothetical protein
MFSPGEVVPKIWWEQILQENSYPNIDEYDFSWRSRTRVLLQFWVGFLLGKNYSGYDFSRTLNACLAFWELEKYKYTYEEDDHKMNTVYNTV